MLAQNQERWHAPSTRPTANAHQVRQRGSLSSSLPSCPGPLRAGGLTAPVLVCTTHAAASGERLPALPRPPGRLRHWRPPPVGVPCALAPLLIASQPPTSPLVRHSPGVARNPTAPTSLPPQPGCTMEPPAALWRLAISGGAVCAGTYGGATAAAGASGAGGVGGASGPVFVDEPAGGPPVVAVPGPLPTPTPTATTTLTGRHIVVLVDSTLRLLLVHSQVPHGSCSASTISWARACRKGSRCCGGRRSSRGHHVAARYGGGRVSVRGRAAWTN